MCECTQPITGLATYLAELCRVEFVASKQLIETARETALRDQVLEHCAVLAQARARVNGPTCTEGTVQQALYEARTMFSSD